VSQPFEYLSDGTPVLVAIRAGDVDTPFSAQMHHDPDLPATLGLFGSQGAGGGGPLGPPLGGPPTEVPPDLEWEWGQLLKVDKPFLISVSRRDIRSTIAGSELASCRSLLSICGGNSLARFSAQEELLKSRSAAAL
jgi:hypothetical protein